MFIVVRKSDKKVKKISNNDQAFNDIQNASQNVSLDIIEVSDYSEKGKALYNRIYHVFDGEFELIINEKQTILHKGDAVFIEKGMTYEIKGTFKATAVNTVANLFK